MVAHIFLSVVYEQLKSRRMRWAGHVARMGEERGVYRVLVGKPEGKRPRRRWVDNIMMDFQEVGCGYMDWIGLAQDRDSWRTLVSAVMNLRVPWNSGNFLTSCKPVSFSRRTLRHGASKYEKENINKKYFLFIILRTLNFVRAGFCNWKNVCTTWNFCAHRPLKLKGTLISNPEEEGLIFSDTMLNMCRTVRRHFAEGSVFF